MAAENDYLLAYYSARAAEYEKVYDKPERQHEIAVLRESIPRYFAGRNVLEVACGTGYWTRLIAHEAATVTATDLSEAVLALARQRQPASHPVQFRVPDALDLGTLAGTFDAAFVGFWWSHVLKRDLAPFLAGLHRRLSPGGRVLIADNRYVEGSNVSITRIDDAGNSYQLRRLEDGSEYEVLKNFPSSDEISARIEAAGGIRVNVRDLQYYWIATYETR